MGWEKYIVLENKKYEQVIDSLYKAFQKFDNQYTLIKDHTGFSLCGNNTKWPEIMEISVEVASQEDNAVPNGEKYIYCLFHICENEAYLFLQTIKSTIDNLDINYVIDDL